jgi:hypothetical protein
MKSIMVMSIIIIIILGACQSPTPIDKINPATGTELTPPSSTPIPTLTISPSPTATRTKVPPTLTFTPICKCAATPSLTAEPTRYPTSESPGVLVRGYVTLPDKTGVSGVLIYSAFAAYEGGMIAITDDNGYYEAFIFIPGDETVRIWAEAPGYSVKPGKGYRGWYNGEFFWRHYAGYELVELSFIVTPIGSPT